MSLDGSFTIPAVPEGHYYVIAEQDGYVSPLALFTRSQLNDPDEALKQKIARYMTTISVTAGHTTQTEITLTRGAVIDHFQECLVKPGPEGQTAFASAPFFRARWGGSVDEPRCSSASTRCTVLRWQPNRRAI